MPWLKISDYDETWSTTRAHDACAKLEAGEILFFERSPFNLTAQDLDALVALRPSDSRLHKNISYRPSQDLLRGFSGSTDQTKRVHDIMRGYYSEVVNFVSRFLAPYAGKFQIDYASFRPLEEEGRDLPFHKRNDLLHVDAFPSRPTRGGRILRVFTNANPRQDRVWKVGPRFPELANSYASSAGLSKFARTGHARRSALHALSSIGLPVPDRSAYDEFMLRFHDWLKENAEFQSDNRAEQLSFPPFSTWLVFTDGVPHAALSGQFALEQTFIIPPDALVSPGVSPIRVLESLAERKLA